MTKKEIKTRQAKENRVEIITWIKDTLKRENSYMTLRTAMDVFLSVNIGRAKDFSDWKSEAYYKVQQAAERTRRNKNKYTNNISENSLGQLPSSMS